MKKKPKRIKKAGFTMIELLSVLVIMGIIIGLAIPLIGNLTKSQTQRAYEYQQKLTGKAADIYIDQYKRGLPEEFSCFNINYQTLLTEQLLKEPEIHCSGTIQATRKKGNNFTYKYYLNCKDKKGKIVETAKPLPVGCAGIYGKFMIDYEIKYNNASGSNYNYNWTNQNLYQQYTAIDLSRPSSTGNAGIKEFKYSLGNQTDWKTISSTTGGIGNWTLSNQYNGKIYFKAVDTDGNDSEVLSYEVKVDKTAPVFNTLTARSANGSYNTLASIITLGATDDLSKGLTMCVSNTGYESGCSYETYTTSKNWTFPGTLDGRARTVYVTVKDVAGNKTNKSTTYTPYSECSQTNLTYGSWGGCSKACGTGTQSRTNTIRDKYTSKVCSNPVESQSCNTQACCSRTVDYQWDGYGACNKACGGGQQYRNIHRKSVYDGSYCGYYQDPVPRACNTQSCEDPNDPNWSKEQACDATKFQAIVNDTAKFKNFIEAQAFRDAMYDCSSVTQGILRKNDAAWKALKQSSRYSLVSGEGKSNSCTCYYNKDSSSAQTTCEKPACSWSYQSFVSGVIYGGRVLVLSATQNWALSSTYDDDGFGDYSDTGSSWDKWGYTSFLLGYGDTITETGGWGSCTRTTNGELNWDVCGSSSEKKNRVGLFFPALQVGLYKYLNYSYDSYTNDRDIHNYYNGTVYVQIFRI